MRNKAWLPHVIAVVSLAVFIVLGLACATTRTPYRPLSDFPGATVIEPVQTTFTSTNPRGQRNRLNTEAHAALLRVARNRHAGNINVVNVTWSHVQGSSRPFRYTANGTIIRFGAAPADEAEYESTPVPTQGVGAGVAVVAALRRAVEYIEGSLPAGARIAVTSIVDHGGVESLFGPVSVVRGPTADFLTNELEHLLLGRNLTVVTTHLDETHIVERRYWGLESDASVAARIGRFAGATVVIIVGIDGTGPLRRLRLRAVNTATMQVVGAASESF